MDIWLQDNYGWGLMRGNISFVFFSPMTAIMSLSSAEATPRTLPNVLMSLRRVAGPTPGISSSKLAV
jgi:hypothetical protein